MTDARCWVKQRTLRAITQYQIINFNFQGNEELINQHSLLKDPERGRYMQSFVLLKFCILHGHEVVHRKIVLF